MARSNHMVRRTNRKVRRTKRKVRRTKRISGGMCGSRPCKLPSDSI